MAERILDRYRKTSGAKPLTAGGMIRDPPHPARGPSGRDGPGRSSLGAAKIPRHGLLGGDDDRPGNRVEPGLLHRRRRSHPRRLRARAPGVDHEVIFLEAGLALPRIATRRSCAWARPTRESASIRLDVLGGNTLTLAFARSDGRLLRVRSPRFDLDFRSPTRFRDALRPGPARRGGRDRLDRPSDRRDAAPRGRRRPRRVRPAGDAPAGRPPGRRAARRRRTSWAHPSGSPSTARRTVRSGSRRASRRRLPLRFTTDVFGRPIAAAPRSSVGDASWPSLFAQISDAVPEGADAVAGACLFREAVVELDLEHAVSALHDPARWTMPEGYVRIVTDDDGNRPVAVFRRGSSDLRLTAASDTAGRGHRARRGQRGTRRPHRSHRGGRPEVGTPAASASPPADRGRGLLPRVGRRRARSASRSSSTRTSTSTCPSAGRTSNPARRSPRRWAGRLLVGRGSHRRLPLSRRSARVAGRSESESCPSAGHTSNHRQAEP